MQVAQKRPKTTKEVKSRWKDDNICYVLGKVPYYGNEGAIIHEKLMDHAL